MTNVLLLLFNLYVYNIYTLYIVIIFFFTHLQAAYKCVWSVVVKRCILVSGGREGGGGGGEEFSLVSGPAM